MIPELTLTSPLNQICIGESCTLHLESNSTIFKWEQFDNNLDRSIVVAPISDFCYIATAFAPLDIQCVKQDSICIKVNPLPEVNFEAIPNPQYIEESDGMVQFKNHTFAETQCSYRWNFGDMASSAYENTSKEMNPMHQYSNAGTYIVTLAATDANQCMDSTTQKVEILPDLFIYFPNSFTPNHDGVNDMFAPKGLLSSYQSYNMYIYSRNGQLIFHTTSFTEGWNGTFSNGTPAPQGAYAYKATLINRHGKSNVFTGAVFLIR